MLAEVPARALTSSRALARASDDACGDGLDAVGVAVTVTVAWGEGADVLHPAAASMAAAIAARAVLLKGILSSCMDACRACPDDSGPRLRVAALLQ
jgi:hypothetical protein